MKTQHTRYQNDAMDASMKSFIEKTTGKVTLEASRFGAINQPDLIGGHMAPCIEGHHWAFQQFIEKVHTELPSEAISYQTIQREESTETLVKDLQNKAAPVKERQAEINIRVKNTTYPLSITRLVLAIMAICGICLFDGIQTIPVYETWGFNLLEAIIAALLFAGVLAVLAHSFLRIVAVGKTLWQKRLIAITLLVLIIALFAFMGNVRAEYLSGIVKANAADSMNIHFSAVPFVLTSVLLFVVAVSICHFYMPTREQREALSAYYRLHKQKKSIDKEVAQLEEQIQRIQAELIELKINHDAILSYGATLEELIVNQAKSCYTLWKHENLFHREDRSKPDCFDEPYPFTFKLHFSTLNPLNHEKVN